MNFADRRRFPKHDSKLVEDSEFNEIRNGVDKRCGMCMLALVQKKRVGGTAEELTNKFNAKYSDPYRYNHVRYALNRLFEAGFATKRGDRYFATESGLARWRACPKNRI